MELNNKNKQNKQEEDGVCEREGDARLPSVRVERCRDPRVRTQSAATNEEQESSSVATSSGAVPESAASTSEGALANRSGGDSGGASSGCIRTRSGKVLPAPEESLDGEDSDSSTVSMPSRASSRSSSKKRGRPPTTGEYVGLAEAKRRFVEAREAEMEVREVEAILDPSVPPRKPGKSAIPLPDESSMAKDYRRRPTADVASLVLEYQDEIEKVAAVSKGLKGNLARALRLAALNTRTAIMELASRSSSAASRELEAENRSLRDQMAELRAEVARLREAVNCRQRPASPELQMREIEAALPRIESVGDDTQSRTPLARQRPTNKVANNEGKEEDLLAKVGSLIDAKLASFKREQALRRVKASDEPSASQPVSKPSKKQRSKRRKQATAASNATVAAKVPQPTGAAGNKEKAPPKTQSSQGETWSKVVGRKERRRDATARTASTNAPANSKQRSGGTTKKAGQNQPAKKVLPARPPRTAAVTVTVPAGVKMTYAEVMTAAKSKIRLADVGIESLKVRRGVTGALVLEVPGQEGTAKADALAAKMSAVLEGTGVTVARPMKRAELRLRGLDDSVTPKEVATAVATAGGCRAEEVQTGEIRSSSSAMGTIWLRCPAAAARKVAVAGKLAVGWVQATVGTLKARPLQCYRCLEMGHTRQRCTNEADRSGRCYNCGDLGHKANSCKASPKCPVCTDQGRPAGHRLGSGACKAASTKGGRGRKTVGATAAAPAAPAADKTKAAGKKAGAVAEKPPVAAQTSSAAPAAMDTAV